MITENNIDSNIIAGWLLVVLLFIVGGSYFRRIAEWILMKLYDLFIGGNNAATS